MAYLFAVCADSLPLLSKNSLLQKYRSMALDYNHDLKAADKNYSCKYRIGEAAQKDLRP